LKRKRENFIEIITYRKKSILKYDFIIEKIDAKFNNCDLFRPKLSNHDDLLQTIIF